MITKHWARLVHWCYHPDGLSVFSIEPSTAHLPSPPFYRLRLNWLTHWRALILQQNAMEFRTRILISVVFVAFNRSLVRALSSLHSSALLVAESIDWKMTLRIPPSLVIRRSLEVKVITLLINHLHLARRRSPVTGVFLSIYSPL